MMHFLEQLYLALGHGVTRVDSNLQNHERSQRRCETYRNRLLATILFGDLNVKLES